MRLNEYKQKESSLNASDESFIFIYDIIRYFGLNFHKLNELIMNY